MLPLLRVYCSTTCTCIRQAPTMYMYCSTSKTFTDHCNVSHDAAFLYLLAIPRRPKLHSCRQRTAISTGTPKRIPQYLTLASANACAYTKPSKRHTVSKTACLAALSPKVTPMDTLRGAEYVRILLISTASHAEMEPCASTAPVKKKIVNTG